MEQKSLWKNFLLLTVGGLLALHLNVSEASITDDTSENDSSEECVLTE